MLTFNTNLQSLLLQRSLKNSTNILNQAIERMSTGFKVNTARDNPANYVISQMMTTHLSALDVAEDNACVGLDLLTMASDTLDMINSRFIRLRDLAIQAENKTYGEESLKAINVECQALVEEIKRLYKEAEFNGLKIYGSEFTETIPTAGTGSVQVLGTDPAPVASSTYATEATTLQELGIDYSSFQIYNSESSLIESYETEKSDTIGDIFNVLETYGFTCSITDGVISISSTNGRYVDGELMQAFGINLDATDFVASSEQKSENVVYYTATQTATEATTLAEIGVLTSGSDTITINDKYGDLLAEFNVTSSTTLGGLFNALGNYDIQGEIDDGIIALNSSSGNYVVSQGVITNLGIGTFEGGNAVTTGTTQTSSGVVTYETVTVSGGEVITVQQEQTTTIWTTTTTSETITETTWITTTTSTTVTETIWAVKTYETIYTTNVTEETYVTTIGSPTTPSYTDEEVAAMTAIQSVSSFTSGQCYKIETAEDLAYLATQVNAGANHSGAIFVLANDIDLSSIANWTAIGTEDYNFEGVFDGNGRVISNLKIDSVEWFQGLFGIAYAEIKNVGLENCDVTGDEYVGGLVGFLGLSSEIYNCYVNGVVSGSERVGGLMGSNGGGGITNCYAMVEVTGDIYVGGLVGEHMYGTIINCYSAGSVVGNEYVGGLVGSSEGAITDSYAVATVSGSQIVGGLVGSLFDSSINSCYASCNVTATNKSAGGLVGEVSNTSFITFCFAKGIVSGKTNAGGLIGYISSSEANVNECYSLTSVSGNMNVAGFIGFSLSSNIVNCATTQTDSYATVMTESQMLSIYTPEQMLFTETYGWTVVDGTPILSWQASTQTTITVMTTTTDVATQAITVYVTGTCAETSGTTWVTVTSVATTTITVDVVTTTPQELTQTIWTTTTTSTTQTEMVDVTQTIEGEATTLNISITSATSFAELELGSRAYITVMNNDTKYIITVKTADTVGSLINKLNNRSIGTSLTNGRITISPNTKSAYISGMSSALVDVLNLEADFYTTSLGQEMTDSNTYIYDGEIAINNSTSLSQIGITSGELVVKQDGVNISTIAVSESQNVASFIQDLENAGFVAYCADGGVYLKANGNMLLDDAGASSSNAISVLGLRNVLQEIDSTYANTNSDQLEKLSEIINTYWQAASEIRLQVGINSDENSQIDISTGFTMHNLDRFANIGKKTVNSYNYISELDQMISTITAKQTELGAYINRLESVLDEISIKYDNLVSSRSTLRDEDLAEASAIYIQQQILQQASATLLAVANQAPQLALQLL